MDDRPGFEKVRVRACRNRSTPPATRKTGSDTRRTDQKGEQPELLHQGIPLSFKQSFNLADHVKVVGANVEHGLLTIDLVREVPEQLKPRRVEIRSTTEAKAAQQDNQPKQIDIGAQKGAGTANVTASPPGCRPGRP